MTVQPQAPHYRIFSSSNKNLKVIFLRSYLQGAMCYKAKSNDSATYLHSLSHFYCSPIYVLHTSSPFTSHLHHSPTSPSLSVFPPHHTHNTVKYLPSSHPQADATWFYPPSLPVCTKTGSPAGEGLTSSIPPSLAFSSLVLFSFPSTSCQDAHTSGLPLEKPV